MPYETCVSPTIAEALEKLVLTETTARLPDGTLHAQAPRIFYLHRPETKPPTEGGRRSYSYMLAFLPEGICLMGDLAASRRMGGYTIRGQGLAWFAGQMDESYLIDKSDIEELWQKELAAKWARAHAEQKAQDGEEEQAEIFRELARQVASFGFQGPEDWQTALQDAGFECDDGVPGYGHHISDSAWLCGIQQRFSKLMSAQMYMERKNPDRS